MQRDDDDLLWVDAVGGRPAPDTPPEMLAQAARLRAAAFAAVAEDEARQSVTYDHAAVWARIQAHARAQGVFDVPAARKARRSPPRWGTWSALLTGLGTLAWLTLQPTMLGTRGGDYERLPAITAADPAVEIRALRGELFDAGAQVSRAYTVVGAPPATVAINVDATGRAPAVDAVLARRSLPSPGSARFTIEVRPTPADQRIDAAPADKPPATR
jgi:hypothetical protein